MGWGARSESGRAGDRVGLRAGGMVVFLVFLGLGGCKPLARPGAEWVEGPEEPSPEPTRVVLATPTPTPEPTPTPPLVWYTLDRISVTTESGVVGYPPGTMVRYIAEGLYFLDGQEVELSPLQVTSSIDEVSEVLAGREAQRQMLERQRMDRQRMEREIGESDRYQRNSVPDGAGGGGVVGSPPGSGWFHSGESRAVRRELPVRRASAVGEGVAASAPTDPSVPPELLERAGAGLDGGAPRAVVPETSGGGGAAASAAVADDGAPMESAVRQYRRGNTNYTVRVTGENVED